LPTAPRAVSRARRHPFSLAALPAPGGGLTDKKIEAFYGREGLEPVGSTPAQLKALFEADIKKYAALIKSRHIPLR